MTQSDIEKFKAKLEKLRQLIAQLNQQGKKVMANWDAGGDSRFCHVYVQDAATNKDEPFPDTGKLDLEDILANEIIFELNLPDATERYHKGGGEILIGGEEVFRIKINSLEYDGNNDHYEESIEYIDLPEVAPQVASYAHKLQFEAYGHLSEEKEMEANINIVYIHGDNAEPVEHIAQSYQKALVKMLEAYKPLILAGNGTQLGGVNLFGNTEGDGRLRLEIEKTFYKTQHHRGTVTPLFPHYYGKNAHD